jgi:predicted dinucleotide-binding enzyme
MKIGVLGSGIVAQTLAAGFIRYGYDVLIGTRDSAKLADWKKRTGGEIGSFADSAAHGELLVLAVKGSSAQSVLNLAGSQNLRGKTIIDTTNPIADAPPVNGVLKYFTTLEESLMERLQKAFPDSRFVKAFSCVGNALMVNPPIKGERPTMFICGNDASAKGHVKEILSKFGWETEDMGAVEGARAIEPLCILWCIPGFLRNEWSHLLTMVRA